MNSLGLYTGLDMRNQSLDFMQANFGKAGSYYYWISRGIDDREVRANRIRKSVGAENTFANDLTEFEIMLSELQPLIDKVWRHCEDKGARGRTVTLKVKFADFELISRSRTVVGTISSRDQLETASAELLKALFPLEKAVRLLGVAISGFSVPSSASGAIGWRRWPTSRGNAISRRERSIATSKAKRRSCIWRCRMCSRLSRTKTIFLIVSVPRGRHSIYSSMRLSEMRYGLFSRRDYRSWGPARTRRTSQKWQPSSLT